MADQFLFSFSSVVHGLIFFFWIPAFIEGLVFLRATADVEMLVGGA